jgi:hypothetical protein
MLCAAVLCVSIVATDGLSVTAESEENSDDLSVLLTNYLASTLEEGAPPTPLGQKISGVARWKSPIKVEIRGAIDHAATARMNSDDVVELSDLVFKEVPGELTSAIASTLKSPGYLRSDVKVSITPSGANVAIVVVDTSTGPNDYSGSTEASGQLFLSLRESNRRYLGIVGDAADFSTFISRTGDNTNDDHLCSALAFFSDDWTIVSAMMLVSRPVLESLTLNGRSALAEHSLLVCAATMMGLNVQAPISRGLSSATVVHALRTLYGSRVSIGEASLSRIKEMIGER